MRNISLSLKTILPLLLVIIFCACRKPKIDTMLENGFAAFDWFEYHGYDPVYESLEPDAGEYLNPILAGFYPDPSIVRVNDDYFMVNSTFSFYPGIPVFHSKDLVHWTQLGHVLDRPSQLALDSLEISQGVFAPAISYHEGTFYVINTIVGGIGNFVVTSPNPSGPWSDPYILPFEGIDPSLFFDDDGKAYIVWNDAPSYEPLYDGHRAIWMVEFDKDKMEITGERKMIIDGGVDISKKPIWIEGPHIYNTNGYYYLMAAEGGTSTGHSEVIFRSSDVWGPYEPWKKNPILTQRHLDDSRANPVTSTGHADIVETQSGEWWAVFLGCTPYENNYYNTGRQTFLLPVTWTDDDWPVILQGSEPVPFSHPKPALEQHASNSIPFNGNFMLRNEFNDSVLSPVWSFIRTPREKWYEVSEGHLFIKSRQAPLHKKGQPSFIGHRQQHHYCSASTSLKFKPANEGDKAGLAAFQNEKHFYLLACVSKNGDRYISLEKGGADGPEELVTEKIDLPDGQTIFLKIESRGKYYDFFYTTDTGEWLLLAKDVDATWLSTHVAGGFVGTFFGLYAYSDK